MANRILKESFKASPDVDRLSWFEECLWNRLIVTVDDFGRYDGRTIMLKNELFPLKEKVTKKQIEDAIGHMEQIGMVQRYMVDGRPYICIPSWEKHQQIRAKKSKFPAPDINGYQMISDDNKISRNPIQSNPIQYESNPNTNTYSASASRLQTRFTKPSLEEIQEYISEKGYTISADRFFNYYESNGWMVGKNHMKSWKSALANWQSKEPKTTNTEEIDWRAVLGE